MEATLHMFAAGATTEGDIKLMSCRMPTLVQLRYIIQLQWNECDCDCNLQLSCSSYSSRHIYGSRK